MMQGRSLIKLQKTVVSTIRETYYNKKRFSSVQLKNPYPVLSYRNSYFGIDYSCGNFRNIYLQNIL